MGNDAKTIEEIYFLVRVGTWDQAQLAEYIHGLVEDAVFDALADEQNNSNYQSEASYKDGENRGYDRGYQDGRYEGYEDGYNAGIRDGESQAARYGGDRDGW